MLGVSLGMFTLSTSASTYIDYYCDAPECTYYYTLAALETKEFRTHCTKSSDEVFGKCWNDGNSNVTCTLTFMGPGYDSCSCTHWHYNPMELAKARITAQCVPDR